VSAEDRALAALTSSVADGDPIDWDGAQKALAPPNRRLVPHLRLVESIAQVYRTLSDPASALELEHGEGPTKWGPLLLLERIGEGTSGEVYRAWDSHLQREVALKLLHHDSAGARQRVLAEARRLARIRHEHVVQVYGAEEHDGRVGLWMEFVRGESLDARLRARGAFTAADAARIGTQLCSALSAVHAAGLLHRDVKAQNVIIEPSGRTVLMDFGTGEPLHQSAGTNRMVGTPLYLAPEVFKGHAATVQSDIYSLGVLLFYLTTGEFPVSASSLQELERAHDTGVRRQLSLLSPDAPVPFVRALERAIEPEAGRRFDSPDQMARALGSVGDASTAPDTRRLGPARRWLFVASAAVLLLATVALIVWTRTAPTAAPDVARVAVLPLVDRSEAGVPPHLADALTDEVISTLGEQTTLQVTSATSTARLRNSSETPAQIAARLGVDALVEGSVFTVREDQQTRVRVNVRLIAASSGTQLWSRTFEGVLGQAFALQSQIARGIARELQASLRPAANATPKPISEQSEESYLLGRYHLAHFGSDRTRQAMDAFQRAIQHDPSHAGAHAGVAQCYVALGFSGAMPQAEARARALSAATTALELEPGRPEAHVALANLKFYYDWNWTAAEADYQQVLALNPSLAQARGQYARFLSALGRLDEALYHAKEAVARDPIAPDAAQTLGLIHYYRREYADALASLNKALQMDPQNARAHWVIGRVHEAAGRYSDAIAAAKHALDLSANGNVGWRLQLLRLRALSGEPGIRRALEASLRQFAREDLHPTHEHIAYVHLALGDRAQALHLLERAVDERDPAVLWFAVDPRLDDLRADSQFAALLKRIGL
jgi:serine/threonine-protein kinase